MRVWSELLQVWDRARARPARLALVLGVVVLAGAAVHVRAGDGPTASGAPAAEAPQADRPELSLEIYLAERVDEAGAVGVPEGKRLFEYEAANGTIQRFLAQGQPSVTEEGVAGIDLDLPLLAPEGRPFREVADIMLEFRDWKRLRDVTGFDVGKPLVIVINGRVVTAPVVVTGLLRWVTLPADGLTEAQREALLSHFGWGEAPEPIEGMGTIRVTAHFADRALPMPAQCLVNLIAENRGQHPLHARERTTITGADGDWAVHNAEPGLWTVTAIGSSFAEPPKQSVAVSAGETASLDFEVGPGGTITGRVVEADTDEPVADAWVNWGQNNYEHHGQGMITDDAGRYVFQRVFPGTVNVLAYTRDRYVSHQTGDLHVREEETVEALEMRLLRGGTIRATIVGPPGMPEDPVVVQQWIEALPLFTLPEGVIVGRSGSPNDGVIETRLLPPGRYRVRATVGVGTSWANPEMSWSGEAGPVEVRIGEATDLGLIEVARDQQ